MSKKITQRRDSILYYDCTNFFFEIEEEDDFRQYGHSKENRPNPIVQMGLFMDADGIPLACTIDAGAKGEQTTLIPLEEKILKDFGLAKFVVSTDAGLSSATNRIFNSQRERQFITTQSIKKLKGHLKDWALDKTGWQMSGHDRVFDLEELEGVLSSDETPQKVKDALSNRTFYKKRMIKEEVSNAGKKETFEQLLIVTFSFKYRSYLRSIRASHINRALRAIEEKPASLKKKNQHDFRRLIKETSATKEGEVADLTVYAIDEAAIQKEARYDGFYGLCTSLDADDIEGILQVNKNRWEIEECFRIIKSEFLARPSFLSRKDRLTAHFLTCFIALLVYRLLEKKLGGKYTCSEIIDCLRSMDFKEVKGEGFEPLYVRSDLTDALHEAFGFYTDFEIVTDRAMKEIIKKTRKPETLRHF
jgi:transposase